MKKILKNNEKTKKYLESLPTIYVIVKWVTWGIVEYPFSGKWKLDEKGRPIPLVWHYNDHNGITDQFELYDLRSTTSGEIEDWTFYRHPAEIMVKYLNENE
jgi:hypothetical protein